MCQSQEPEGSDKPARIKEVHLFQASLCTLTATHLTLIYVLHIHSAECTVTLLNQADRNRLLYKFFAQVGPGPLIFFQGGGAFQPQGGLFRSNFNPKNHNFPDDFPVIFWYIHIMLLQSSLNETN